MLSRRIIPSCIRHANRGLSTTIESTAKFVFENSCYHKTDFKIQEDSPVAEVIAKFVAFDVGCLAVLDKEKKLIGVVSQRDIITKVCASDKFNPSLKVKDICTYGNNIIVAKTEDSVETCMNKMNYKKVRHLLVVDDKNSSFVGMISMKDIIQEMLRNKTELVMRLSDFKIGKGAFFGSE